MQLMTLINIFYMDSFAITLKKNAAFMSTGYGVVTHFLATTHGQ